jgi:hypothetical protein
MISAQLLPQGTAVLRNNWQKEADPPRRGQTLAEVSFGARHFKHCDSSRNYVSWNHRECYLQQISYRRTGRGYAEMHTNNAQRTLNPPELPPPAAAPSCQQQSGKDNAPDCSLLQTLTVPQLVKKKFPHLIESDGSLPRPQQPASYPYPKPD